MPPCTVNSRPTAPDRPAFGFTAGGSRSTMRSVLRSSAPGRVARLLLLAGLCAAVIAGIGPAAHPSPVRAATADTMASSILAWINAERSTKGLVPLRLHPGLVDLAGERASYMASIGAMQHISCLSCALNARGIQWYG